MLSEFLPLCRLSMDVKAMSCWGVLTLRAVPFCGDSCLLIRRLWIEHAKRSTSSEEQGRKQADFQKGVSVCMKRLLRNIPKFTLNAFSITAPDVHCCHGNIMFVRRSRLLMGSPPSKENDICQLFTVQISYVHVCGADSIGIFKGFSWWPV